MDIMSSGGMQIRRRGLRIGKYWKRCVTGELREKCLERLQTLEGLGQGVEGVEALDSFEGIDTTGREAERRNMHCQSSPTVGTTGDGACRLFAELHKVGQNSWRMSRIRPPRTSTTAPGTVQHDVLAMSLNRAPWNIHSRTSKRGNDSEVINRVMYLGRRPGWSSAEAFHTGSTALRTGCNSDQAFEQLETGSKSLRQTLQALRSCSKTGPGFTPSSRIVKGGLEAHRVSSIRQNMGVKKSRAPGPWGGGNRTPTEHMQRRRASGIWMVLEFYASGGDRTPANTHTRGHEPQLVQLEGVKLGPIHWQPAGESESKELGGRPQLGLKDMNILKINPLPLTSTHSTRRVNPGPVCAHTWQPAGESESKELEGSTSTWAQGLEYFESK
ncbi:hypothetical protein B0H11DRAFT_2209924 [Mycena galericulata]|nr:hypothetical protein B0H11DRAFT_2209924 [Mycena galericulata]